MALRNDKLSRASAGYEHPARGPDHCGVCRHFERPSACAVVRGEIRSEDWCERFRHARRVALYDRRR